MAAPHHNGVIFYNLKLQVYKFYDWCPQAALLENKFYIRTIFYFYLKVQQLKRISTRKLGTLFKFKFIKQASSVAFYIFS